jgi:hypothetical protein
VEPAYLPWYGRVWLNPPYSQPHIFNFVRKLVSELDNIKSAILLTHNHTDTEWFHLAQKHAPTRSSGVMRSEYPREVEIGG